MPPKKAQEPGGKKKPAKSAKPAEKETGDDPKPSTSRQADENSSNPSGSSRTTAGRANPAATTTAPVANRKSNKSAPKSGVTAGNKDDNAAELKENEVAATARPVRQSAARKRVLAEKNADSGSDFEEETVVYRTTPKQTKPRANKKIKKTPEESKKAAQQTRNRNQEKYLANLGLPDESSNHNNNSRKYTNFCELYSSRVSGSVQPVVFSDNVLSSVIQNIAKFKVWSVKTPFDRRVTALAWHPDKPGLACAGSKGGDLVLWNVYQDQFMDLDTNRVEEFNGRIEGRGPGGSIQSLVFDQINPNRVYIASIDGTVALKDFEGKADKVFLDTDDWNQWYTGLDVNFAGKTIVAGRSTGEVTLLSLDGQEMWSKKLHKTKCNFVQFSSRQPWLVVTSSIDHVVKIWDIRNIKDKTSSLAELQHEKPVNGAYFSSLSGDKLLTTDQHSQIRIYQGPYWDLSRTITHPHRHFQHLTDIKACWHPLVDIPFSGRYPDPAFPGYQEGEPRSIDFFSPESGETLLNLHQPGLDKIISLAQFNPTGDFLLCGMASSLLVWKQRPPEDEEEDASGARESRPKPSAANLWPEFNTKKVKKPREKKKKE